MTSFQYAKGDVRGVAVFITNTQSGLERRVHVGNSWVPLPIESVVPKEHLSPQDTGFEVRVDGEDLLFRKAFARTRATGSKDIRLPMGRTGRLGPTRVVGRPLVEATIEVRNAFGNVRTASKTIALPFDIEPPEHAALIQTSEASR